MGNDGTCVNPRPLPTSPLHCVRLPDYTSACTRQIEFCTFCKKVRQALLPDWMRLRRPARGNAWHRKGSRQLDCFPYT
jgi:hypothetical protein